MTSHIKAKIANPADHFDTPKSVLRDNDLNRDQKIKVLQSMVLDADQMLVTASEGMSDPKKTYDADDLQSALVELEKAQEPAAVYDPDVQKSRFQRVMVVTTVDQDMNREIADVAYGIAATSGGKVYLLSVVPPASVGSVIAVGSMGAAVPLVATDNTQIIDDRKQQLADLSAENTINVTTEIEVRSGQVEDVIVDYAGDCAADIIVVGSANRSWLETLLNPSIVRRVTSAAPCPILVVPVTP